ncbi:MAG: hypothetical protein JXA71_13225 [Chitinispirillaceae bacterium]|nr:hypothetical protein [Chitinispirillaceae bacterium]
MKHLVIIPLIALSVFAGRTSQWSNVFTLREPTNTIQKISPAELVKPFGLSVRPGSSHCMAVLNVGGIIPGSAASLIIYEVNGKIAADLSTLARSGLSTIVWRPPASRSGIFIARLQNGSKVQTVRFMLFK